MRLRFWRKPEPEPPEPPEPPGPDLSPDTRRAVDLLFVPGDRQEASRLLIESCGNNLPGSENEDMYEKERIRFAVLKLSRGNVERLSSAVILAMTDWRDVLSEAGFDNDLDAHRAWFASLTAKPPQN